MSLPRPSQIVAAKSPILTIAERAVLLTAIAISSVIAANSFLIISTNKGSNLRVIVFLLSNCEHVLFGRIVSVHCIWPCNKARRRRSYTAHGQLLRRQRLVSAEKLAEVFFTLHNARQ